MTAAKPVTVPSLAAMKADNRPIVMLTTYDASFAQRVDEAGVDVVLVGDSLGNVIQGRDSTLPVTVDDMVYHTRAVKNGLSRALLVTDLPFMSYHDRDSAMRSAKAVMQAGAQMVKLEGGAEHAPVVSAMVANGIPVCAHLGLTPQHVHQLGGYRVQGRDQGPANSSKAMRARWPGSVRACWCSNVCPPAWRPRWRACWTFPSLALVPAWMLTARFWSFTTCWAFHRAA